MNWKKALSYGLLIWMVMFVGISILVAFAAGPWAKNIVGWLIVIAITWYAAVKCKIKSAAVGFRYGLAFVVIGLILDYLISTKYTGMALFTSKSYWLGYALTLLIPVYVGSQGKS